jgi:hypothetical protein
MLMTRNELLLYYGAILNELPNFLWTSEVNGAANCPAHADRHRSLSVRFGRNGELLLNCHADHGCSFEEIAAALGRPRGSGRMAEFFPPKTEEQATKARGTVERLFDYVNLAGEVVYQSVRMKMPDGAKNIFQRRPDPDKPGAYVNDLAGVEQIPFHLPDRWRSCPTTTRAAGSTPGWSRSACTAWPTRCGWSSCRACG